MEALPRTYDKLFERAVDPDNDIRAGRTRGAGVGNRGELVASPRIVMTAAASSADDREVVNSIAARTAEIMRQHMAEAAAKAARDPEDDVAMVRDRKARDERRANNSEKNQHKRKHN